MTDFPGLEKRETRATRQVSPTEGRTWGHQACPLNSAKASPNRLMDWFCLAIQRIRSHLSARVMQGCHAIRRAFVPVFRAALGFLRASAAGFLVLVAAGFLVLATVVLLALATASTGAGNSSLGGFRVRWWAWCWG